MVFLEQEQPGVNFFKNKADYSSVKKQELFYQLPEEATRVVTTTRVVGLQLNDHDFSGEDIPGPFCTLDHE